MLKNKTKDEKKKSPYTVRSEAVTLNLKASNSTLFFFVVLQRENAGPPVILLPLYHFQCHTSERGRGARLAFCSENRCSFVLQVRKMDFSQTIPTHA